MSIRLTRVAMAYGDNELFHDVTTTIGGGEKVALIGRNGSGKSTLLHIIAGQESATAGSVRVTGSVQFLGQAADGAIPGPAGLKPAGLQAAELELRQAEVGLARDPEANLDAYGLAEERYRLLGGYEFENQAATVLAGLGLEAGKSPGHMSGGEQRRWLFARSLLADHDILLLDEPTNHLDAASREWLESWLLASPATVLFVSHDRAFLNKVAGRVLELERGRLNDWPGNLDEAMRQKQLAADSHRRAWQAQERRRRGLEVEMQRLASKARSADHFNGKRASGQPLLLAKTKAENVSRTLAGRQKALEKRLEREQPVQKPFDDSLRIRIPLPDLERGPNEVLRAKGLSVSRQGRRVIEQVDLQVMRGSKIALVGRNGSGKSSLLRALRGHLPHEGELATAVGLSVFETWQHGEELDAFRSLGEAILAAQPALRRQDVHYLLGQLALPTDPDLAVSALSGGQRTKLALARLSVTRAQLLVLDEPSNNLDLGTLAALEQLLIGYPGTILFASHDRELVAKVADVRWELEAARVTVMTNDVVK